MVVLRCCVCAKGWKGGKRKESSEVDEVEGEGIEGRKTSFM